MSKDSSDIALPVSGTFPDAAGGTGTFAGTLTIRGFVRGQKGIFALGTLSGALVDSRGQPIGGTVRQMVTLPLDLVSSRGTAELGPVQVELLGRRVDLGKLVVGLDEPQAGQPPAAG